MGCRGRGSVRPGPEEGAGGRWHRPGWRAGPSPRPGRCRRGARASPAPARRLRPRCAPLCAPQPACTWCKQGGQLMGRAPIGCPAVPSPRPSPAPPRPARPAPSVAVRQRRRAAGRGWPGRPATATAAAAAVGSSAALFVWAATGCGRRRRGARGLSQRKANGPKSPCGRRARRRGPGLGAAWALTLAGTRAVVPRAVCTRLRVRHAWPWIWCAPLPWERGSHSRRSLQTAFSETL